jgi:hypothetical protein
LKNAKLANVVVHIALDQNGIQKHNATGKDIMIAHSIKNGVDFNKIKLAWIRMLWAKWKIKKYRALPITVIGCYL